MRKLVLGISASILAAPFALGAQTNVPSAPNLISSCAGGVPGGGPDCPRDRRLLVDLRLHGKGATPDVAEVIDIGASAGGVFALTPPNSTTIDSVAFAVVDVTRDVDGTYRIVARMTGSLVTTVNDCHNESTGRLRELAFGARLAALTTQFVRCAQNNRAYYRRE